MTNMCVENNHGHEMGVIRCCTNEGDYHLDLSGMFVAIINNVPFVGDR